MATEFSREFFSENRIVKADLRAAHQLREEDIARIKAEVKKLYDATEVILNVSVDESLLSGYVLQVGDRVFDNSGRHQLDQMMAGKPSLGHPQDPHRGLQARPDLCRGRRGHLLCRWHRAGGGHGQGRLRRDRHL